MKKYILCLIVCVFTSLVLTNCGKNDPINDIVGTWKYSDGNCSIQIKFLSNQSFQYNSEYWKMGYYHNKTNTYDYKGVWTINGKEIHLEGVISRYIDDVLDYTELESKVFYYEDGCVIEQHGYKMRKK